MTSEEIDKSIARIEATGIEDGEVSVSSAAGVETTHRVRRTAVKAAKYPKKARVLYIGQAGRRVVDEYEWNEGNGFVQTVEGAEMVERLLRNGDFVIFENAPDSPATDKEGV